MNGRHRVIDVVFLLIFIVVFVCFVMAKLSSVNIGGSIDRNHEALGELVQGMTIQQAVPVEHVFLADTFCYHVLFATYRRTNSSELQISLRQGEYSHAFRLNASVLKDNQYYPLCFPARGLSNGTALLEIAGVNGGPKQSLTVWMTTDIPYGGAIHRGAQINKGLVFRASAKRPIGRYLGGIGLLLLIGVLSVFAVSVRHKAIRERFATGCIWFKEKTVGCCAKITMTDWRQPVLSFYLIAWTLSLVMATVSQFSSHPDEGLHSASASYYEKHHLPPPVGDPSSLSTYKSRYGVSYINQSGIDYFLIGKFSAVIQSFISLNDFYLHRCFNIFIFFVLCVLVWSAEDRQLYYPVVMTPQVWYIASYTNNDFFPCVMMMIFCFEVIDPRSFCSRAIRKGDAIGYAVPAGMILGVLAISKSNYLVFVLYSVYYLFWIILKTNRFQFNRNLVCGHTAKACLVIVGCAISIFALRTGFDIYQNGWGKNEKLKNFSNQMAQVGFRPVDIETNIHQTASGLRLKEKGVSLMSLLTEKSWLRQSVCSFLGVYGWMTIKAPEPYYIWMMFLIGLLLCYASIQTVATIQSDKIFFLITSCIFICLMIAASVYNSWTYDFQPQGRYLFPVLGMLTILIYELREFLNRNVLGLIFSVLFFFSFWSFVFIGIYKIEKIV